MDEGTKEGMQEKVEVSDQEVMPDDIKSLSLDLAIASMDIIELLLEEAEETEIFEEVFSYNKNRIDVLRLLYDHPHTPDKVRDEVAVFLSLPVKSNTEVAEIKQKAAEVPPQKKFESMSTKLLKMTVMERIKLAAKGSREIRTVLIKDSNKLVVLSVMDNPKISETEIEMIAKSRNIVEEALRKIAKNRHWMKNYNVLLALISNPKTPPAIALSFITSLKFNDLAQLEKNKNVAEVIRSAVKRTLSAKKKSAG